MSREPCRVCAAPAARSTFGAHGDLCEDCYRREQATDLGKRRGAGRPPGGRPASDRKLCAFRLPEHTRELLEVIAKELDRTHTEVITRAVALLGRRLELAAAAPAAARCACGRPDWRRCRHAGRAPAVLDAQLPLVPAAPPPPTDVWCEYAIRSAEGDGMLQCVLPKGHPGDHEQHDGTPGGRWTAAWRKRAAT